MALLAAVNVTRTVGVLPGPWVSMGLLLAGLAVIAWLAGATARDVGLAPADVPAGLRYGFAAFGVVALALVVAALLPGTSDFLHDSRGEISGGRLIHEMAVSIILLTAIPEELAFRGVLLGSAVTAWGARRGAVAASVAFGLWHIAPTLHTMSDNQVADRASSSVAGQALVVLGAVAVTFVAGLVFCWLRLRSKSLVAPLLAHIATNGLALTAAWFATH